MKIPVKSGIASMLSALKADPTDEIAKHESDEDVDAQKYTERRISMNKENKVG